MFYDMTSELSIFIGLGRPANLGDDEDDDGGFGKRDSPSNEMLTLEQFLMESSKSSSKVHNCQLVSYIRGCIGCVII